MNNNRGTEPEELFLVRIRKAPLYVYREFTAENMRNCVHPQGYWWFNLEGLMSLSRDALTTKKYYSCGIMEVFRRSECKEQSVWGKVMILLASVILSTGRRGSLYDVTSCLAAWYHVPSMGVSVSGPMFLLGGLCPG